jgi:tRNA 2-thiouridine synthesizing protein A
MSQTITQTLDLTGFNCPIPIVKTARAFRDLASGDLVEVLVTDPGAVQDFPAWCRSTGNELVETIRQDAVIRFLLRKR